MGTTKTRTHKNFVRVKQEEEGKEERKVESKERVKDEHKVSKMKKKVDDMTYAVRDREVWVNPDTGEQKEMLRVDKTVYKNCNFHKVWLFDLIAAIPLAATPLGEALSLTTDKPLITPRPPKSHGIDSGVDGVYTKGQTALLLDDLITKGDSKFTPIDTMRKKGLVVNDILVLVDREQGGREELKKYKVKLHAIMTFSELFTYYKKSGKIDSATFTRVTSYINHS